MKSAPLQTTQKSSEGGGPKKCPFQLSFTTWGRLGGDVKELLDFFKIHVYVGVFHYDFGTPKHALELINGLNFFGFCLKELNFHGLELKVHEEKFRVLKSF